MSDVLTQIQDELDNLLLRMTSALRVIKHRAPPAPIPGQPKLSSFAEHEAQQAAAAAQSNPQNQNQNPEATAAEGVPTAAPPGPELPLSDEELRKQLRELSQDIVAKEQQLEVLIHALPGRGVSEMEQEERMRALEREIEEVEAERRVVVQERETLVEEVERAILGVASRGSGA